MKLLRDALFLARHDLGIRLRYPETRLWLFLMPILFMFFFGVTFGGGLEKIRSFPLELEAPADAGILAEAIEARLAVAGVQTTRVAPPDLDDERAPEGARLIIPPGFSPRVEAGESPALVFARPDEGAATMYQEFTIRRATASAMADWAIAQMGLAPGVADLRAIPDATRLEAARALPRRVTLEISPAGRRASLPTGFEHVVPGAMVWFVLQGILTIGGVSLLALRKSGILTRLGATQIDRRSIVLGQWLSSLALAALQIVWLTLVGRWLFGVEWGANLGFVWVVMLVYSAALSSFAILLGSVLRTPAQVTGVGVLVSVLLASLGGCAWPIELASEPLQRLAMLLPTGWTIDAIHKLVSFGDPPSEVLPHLLALTLLGAALLKLATMRFRLEA